MQIDVSRYVCTCRSVFKVWQEGGFLLFLGWREAKTVTTQVVSGCGL